MKPKAILLLFIIFIGSHAWAGNADFTFIKTVSKAELENISNGERLEFLQATPPSEKYKTPRAANATNDVDIYSVSYQSSIPEKDGKQTRASGLVAIPAGFRSGALPIVSYQHGTVYGKYEVPSYSFRDSSPSPINHYKGSYETRLAVAQFAGRGKIVIAADYFGMGDSTEPDSYLVKASEQQACLDLYKATVEWLKSGLGIEQQALFLSGWSQGGFVTMAFLEMLEDQDIPVMAASTASAPNDLFASLFGAIYHPAKISAPWINTILSLSGFSFQDYYSKPGLVSSIIKPEYIEPMRRIYARDYSSEEELVNLILSLTRHGKLDLKMLLKTEFSNPAAFANTEYGALLKQSSVYRHYFLTPVQMNYGTLDEAIPVPIAQLGEFYQKSMGVKNVSAIPVEGANHRATFLTAVARQVGWFDRIIQR
jgi:pimeloyl-ACP methyl ester carboxylesterase